jgi:hypothetical protein
MARTAKKVFEKNSNAKRLLEFESENAKLKPLLAEAHLDAIALRRIRMPRGTTITSSASALPA